jgi:hypothetical protein
MAETRYIQSPEFVDKNFFRQIEITSPKIKAVSPFDATRRIPAKSFVSRNYGVNASVSRKKKGPFKPEQRSTPTKEPVQ